MNIQYFSPSFYSYNYLCNEKISGQANHVVCVIVNAGIKNKQNICI